MSDETPTPPLSDRIRSWLLKNPRPVVVHVISTSGNEHDVRIPSRPRWRDVAETIVTLEPESLQALDAEGEVLRAERLVEGAAEAAEEPDTWREIPIPAALSRDPETLRLTHFANLLARAHEKSNDFVRQFGEIIIQRTDHLEERLERSEERHSRTEAAYQAEVHARMKAELESMAAGGDSKDETIRTFLQSFMNGRNEQQAASSNGGTANGARRRPSGWGFGGGDG